jgi:ribonucleoside-diphosphate reductase alpha chain
MISCKTGNWWELNAQRGRANNSAVLMRHKITKEFFMDLWKRVELSGAGEPGIYLNNDKDWGTNPCCEIALRPYQFCNLCEVNVSNIESQEDLNERVKVAAFIGTLQAGYTSFHYLREIWRETTEKDALIGVSMTGIGSGKVLNYDMKKAASLVKRENTRVSKLLDINQAARTTCVKPAGTTSLTLGTSSGIHAWHNDFYIRRIRVGKNEAIYSHLQIHHPELVQDEYFRPHDTAVIEIPQSAPKGSILRTESAFQLLERVKKVAQEWVNSGHRKGSNSHNVSATISLREHEWDAAGEWMWENKSHYNGLAVLPYDGGSYIQAPFEDITEERYHEMLNSLKEINLSGVIELDDNTDLSGELACAGGTCEIDVDLKKVEEVSETQG